MVKRVQFIVFGRVQGVMYRDFTQRTAKKLGIKGEVENMEDGTVRVDAEGIDEALSKFEEALSRGPIFARVEKIIRKDIENLKNYDDFIIVYRNFWDRF